MHVFETTEGEAISQLISGYVNITLKMTPMYEVILGNPTQGPPPKKPEDTSHDGNGYAQITDDVLGSKKDSTNSQEPNTETDTEGENKTSLDAYT